MKKTILFLQAAVVGLLAAVTNRPTRNNYEMKFNM